MTAATTVIDLLLSIAFGTLLPFGILGGVSFRILRGSLLRGGLGLASLPSCFLAVFTSSLLACHLLVLLWLYMNLFSLRGKCAGFILRDIDP